MNVALDGWDAERTYAAAACAGAGAWFLARELRLGVGARAFAAFAVVIAGSAFAPADALAAAALPWLFVTLERVRTASGTARRASACLACVCAAAAVAYAAESATSFYTALASLVWTFYTPGVALGAVAWSCAALACGASIGLASRGSALAASAGAPLAALDLVAIGVTVVCAALVLRWRALERSAPAHDARARCLGGAGIVCALGAAFWIFAQRGDPAALAALFAPGHAGVFLASATAALVCAALFETRATFPRGNVVGALAFGCTALASGVPGTLDLARALPFGAEFEPAAVAPLAALFLALAAAGALEHAHTRARRAGAALLCVLVALAVFVTPAPESSRALPAPDADDELVGWLARPSAEARASTPPLVFWQHAALRAEPRLFVAGLDADGVQVPDAGAEFALERVETNGSAATESAATEPAAHAAPPGARVFRALPLDARTWSADARNVCAWRVQLVLIGAGDVVLGERCAGAFLAPEVARVSVAYLGLGALAVFALIALRRGRTQTVLAWLALLVAQAVLAHTA